MVTAEGISNQHSCILYAYSGCGKPFPWSPAPLSSERVDIYGGDIAYLSALRFDVRIIASVDGYPLRTDRNYFADRA